MKTFKNIAIAIFASLAAAGGVQAQVIAIDFNNGGATNQSPGSTAVVGPVPTAGWNNNVDVSNPPITYTNPYSPGNYGTPQTLVDTTGATTTAQFGFNTAFPTLNGGVTYSPNYGASGSSDSTLTADQQLYNGGVYSANGGYTQQLALTNVSYASYTVVLLVAAQDGAVGYPYPTGGYGEVTSYTNYSLADNTATQGASYWFYGANGGPIPAADSPYIAATGTTQATATQGANYVEFTGLTGANVAFDLSSPVADGNAGAYITGVEIINTAAAPEPSTYLMMLGGLVALVGLRRRVIV